jgi:hypothetical protein
LGQPHYFAVTKDRKACYKAVLNSWAKTMRGLQTGDAFRSPLLATPAAPGAGKTRFAYMLASRGRSAVGGSQCLDAEWEEALVKVEDPTFCAVFENSVGVTVTFNHMTTPRLHEPFDRSLVGVRMLYSHFVRGCINYDAFLDFFQRRRPSPAEALAAIRLDIDTNYPLPTSGDRRHIILVVDELLAASNDVGVRADITTGLGEIIDGNADVHVAVTSLSEYELMVTLGPSMRAVKTIILTSLTEASVNDLISTLPSDLQASLSTDVFRAIVLECVGVPRLLEVVCKIVPMCGTAPTLQGVRGLVAADEMVIAKHVDIEKRHEAVHLTLSAWRYLPPVDGAPGVALKEFQQRLDALMKEGYLYRIRRTAEDGIAQAEDGIPLWQQAGIPPLMLRAWDIKYNGDSNPMLKAAVKFLSNDDVVGAYDGKRDFELQAEALIEILFLVDHSWRCKNATSASARRTIRSILGADKDDFLGAVHTSARVDPKASFNLELADDGRLLRGEVNGKQTAGFDTLAPNMLYHFNSFNFKGADAFLPLRRKAVGDAALKNLLVFFQWKFSDPESAASYTHYGSLAKTLAGRPELTTAFLEGRLCFVLLGMRTSLRLTDIQFRNIVDEVANNKELRGQTRKTLEALVSKSLVVVGKAHAKALAGPTLGSLVQFASATKT